MLLTGYVHKFGNNIDTDVIIPARYCTTVDAQELAKHCMFDLYKDFYMKVNDSDIIVAGNNFGCGSSREAAPVAIKGLGIKCIIAKSFARIFFRNAINIGLMLIQSEQLYDLTESGELITVDTDNKVILKNNQTLQFDSKDNHVVNEIIEAGGLVNYVNRRLLKHNYSSL